MDDGNQVTMPPSAMLKLIYELCDQAKETKASCVFLHGRLQTLQDEITRMAAQENREPPYEIVHQLTEALTTFSTLLEPYSEFSYIERVLNQGKLKRTLEALHNDVDVALRMLDLHTQTTGDWKTQWQQDVKEQEQKIKTGVSLTNEYRTAQAQNNAMLLLRFEVDKVTDGTSDQPDDVRQLVKLLLTTFVRLSGVSMAPVPKWFVPKTSISYDRVAFAYGSFASLHRGTWLSSAKVVVKVLMLDTQGGLDILTQKAFLKEADLWFSLNHPYVIRLFGACHVASRPFFVCEDATGGNLVSFLADDEANKRRMWRLLYQAALGLEFLHRKQIVHGDIKLNNVLVGSDGCARVSDFGLSEVASESEVRLEPNSTPMGGSRWLAPERFQMKPHFASDVFALGMSLIEAVSGLPPYEYLDDETVRGMIRDGQLPERPDGMPDSAWMLVKDMTKKDPRARITMDVVVSKLKILADEEEEQENPSSKQRVIGGGAAMTARSDTEREQHSISGGNAPNATEQEKPTDLFSATYDGLVDEVVRLLSKSTADVNVPNKNGETPLFWAAASSQLLIVQVLLGAQADPDIPNKNKETPLLRAAASGYVDIVKELVEARADVNLPNRDGDTPLLKATAAGHSNIVDVLLLWSVDVNQANNAGETPLLKAASINHLDIVKRLLENEANVNHMSKDLDFMASFYQNKTTPLLEASKAGDESLINALLEAGADTSAINKLSESALHIAVKNGNLSAVRVLALATPKLDATATDGQTPLAIALFAESKLEIAYSMARSLCASGATWSSDCVTQRELMRSKLSDSATAKTEQEILQWRLGLLACVEHWTGVQRRGSGQNAIDEAALLAVPDMILIQGDDSVVRFLKDSSETNHDERIFRRKVCVVGCKTSGKTSFTRSIQSMKPSLVKIEDRTIGVDLCSWSFKEAATNMRHEVVFWDFAGQEVYQAAHGLYFSKKTLYLVCVDLEAYEQVLMPSAERGRHEIERDAAQFVTEHVFRWVVLVLARQPEAEFVVVGTKRDRVVGEDAVANIWEDLEERIAEWMNQLMFDVQEQKVTAWTMRLTAAPRAKSSAVSDECKQQWQRSLDHLLKGNRLTVSCADDADVQAARRDIEAIVAATRDRAFPMPITHTSTLRLVQESRAVSRPLKTSDDIRQIVKPLGDLRRSLFGATGLDLTTRVDILDTLRDLGEVLWYDYDNAGPLNCIAFLDPMLVIDTVRQVVNHTFSGQEGSEYDDLKKNGTLRHELLVTFPVWKLLDEDLLRSFKLMLKSFQLAYADGDEEMKWNSDLIVPSYWASNNRPETKTVGGGGKRHSMLQRINGNAVVRWEYVISSGICDVVFQQFAAESHAASFKRTIGSTWIDVDCAPEFTAQITHGKRRSTGYATFDFIRIEIVATSEFIAWKRMRFFVMAMEQVLTKVPGVGVTRNIIAKGEIAHDVDRAITMLTKSGVLGQDITELRVSKPWLPPDLEWYTQKAWLNPSVLAEIEAREHTRQQLEALSNLVAAPQYERQFPSIWTLQYSGKRDVELQMLSDVSGACFHKRICVPVPPEFLQKYGVALQVGLSVLSNLTPDIFVGKILSMAVGLVVNELGVRVERAKVTHSLIAEMELTADGFASNGHKGLSPETTTRLLQDLLKLHDADYARKVSELSNLVSARTKDGHYVWASQAEIEQSQRTPNVLIACSRSAMAHAAPASPSNGIDMANSPAHHHSSLARVAPLPSVSIQLQITGAIGLSDKESQHAFCKWQLENEHGLLEKDTTVTNEKHASGSQWGKRTMTFTSVTTIAELKNCTLKMSVKRKSLWTTTVDKGALPLTHAIPEELLTGGSEIINIKIPLCTTKKSGRFVTGTLKIEPLAT